MTKQRTEQRTHRIETVLQRKQPDLTVVCENVHDPHNVSAIVRTCDAVGVDTLHLVYNTELFPDIAHKSSAGLKKWIDFKEFLTVAECKKELHAQGMHIYATTLQPHSISMYDCDFTQACAVVMGNEHRGISDSWKEHADTCIMIPMKGLAQSLNVSVATAVILYEALRQRQEKGLYESTRYSPSIYQEKLNQWLSK